MKNLIRILVLTLLVTGAFAQDQNPFSVWCDYHSQYFYKYGQEYPNGVCYDTYKHTYFKDRRQYEHRMSMRCAK